MKIVCKWVFKTGKDFKELKAKYKYIDDMNADQVMDMITTLLAQNETVRIMFEREELK